MVLTRISEKRKLVNQGTLLELIHVIVQDFLIYICTIYLEKIN